MDLPMSAKKQATESGTKPRGGLWPVLIGLAALVALLPLRAGLTVLFHFPVVPAYWELSRAAGLLTYLCLWLAAVSGAANRLPIPAALRPLQMEFHQWGAVWATYVGLFHAVILLWDRYIGFTVRDLLVPFSSAYKPLLVGVGSLALYVVVIVVLTTYFRTSFRTTTWRWLHALSYPGYVLATWHGVALGTDSPLTWVRVFYISTTVILGLLVVVRLTYQPARERDGRHGAS
jgi:predicted ferric reductase